MFLFSRTYFEEFFKEKEQEMLGDYVAEIPKPDSPRRRRASTIRSRSRGFSQASLSEIDFVAQVFLKLLELVFLLF